MNRHSLYISSFKKNIIFFGKLIFMFLGLILFCFIVVMPQYTGGYNASLMDKVSRLKSIEEPKIVLIGDSNVAFGINSAEVEHALGMPVVNMGLHGGVGNTFHENMAKVNVREGDIYIICHSSFSDKGMIGDETLAWSIIENHLELWQLLNFGDLWPMAKKYPTYFKKCLELFVAGSGNQLSDGCYSRNAFNEYGDVAVERVSSLYTFENPVEPSRISETTIKRINKLNNWLDERGAVLLVAGYPIGKGDLTAPEREFLEIQNELSERLVCPLISDYRDYMFDYSLFYDTELHLTTEGANLRTKQLIEDLKNWKKEILEDLPG